MERYGIEVTRTLTEDAVEPATVAEVKALLGIDFEDHDSAIARYCVAARVEAERFCGRVFAASNVVVSAVFWEGNYAVPFAPISEFVSLKNHEDETISNYKLKGNYLDVTAPDGLKLTFVSGGECEDDAKVAIAMLAAWKFDNQAVPTFKGEAYETLKQYKKELW